MSNKDTIYRQAAIDEIEYELEMINSALDSITLDFNARERLRQRRGEAREILNSIQQLPSAQTERKKGKWIIRDNPGTGWYRVTCSECGEDVTSTVPVIGFFPDAKVLWDYCPYCGSFNGGEDETDS